MNQQRACDVAENDEAKRKKEEGQDCPIWSELRWTQSRRQGRSWWPSTTGPGAFHWCSHWESRQSDR